MEEGNKTTVKKKNGYTNISKEIATLALQWMENVTEIDLSNRNISNLCDKISFPSNLVSLNISHNEFRDVPTSVLNIANLKMLNLSYNIIHFFDDNPNFCDSLEELNLANNRLNGPPYWVWANNPKSLVSLNLSGNTELTKELTDEYFAELLEYTTSIIDIKIYNCRLSQYTQLMTSFQKAKNIEFGTADYSYYGANNIKEIPCVGFDKCCDIETLNLSNTKLLNISPKIDMYKNLQEINLSQNNLPGLPNEFCLLENLEICVLSSNNILYLPDDMSKLKKLVILQLDSNELCTISKNLCQLPNLRILDLYDNMLYEVPIEVNNLEELDLAQNYFEEPSDTDYIEKKKKLRLNNQERYNGRKEEVTNLDTDSMHTSRASDDEELIELINSISINNEIASPQPNMDPPSSPEDWDSDDYWVPSYYRGQTRSPEEAWLVFVKQKMKEGNFCPMDVHPISVVDRVRYEKMCNPKVLHEFEGQFDDLSDDNS